MIIDLSVRRDRRQPPPLTSTIFFSSIIIIMLHRSWFCELGSHIIIITNHPPSLPLITPMPLPSRIPHGVGGSFSGMNSHGIYGYVERWWWGSWESVMRAGTCDDLWGKVGGWLQDGISGIWGKYDVMFSLNGTQGDNRERSDGWGAGGPPPHTPYYSKSCLHLDATFAASVGSTRATHKPPQGFAQPHLLQGTTALRRFWRVRHCA